MWSDDPGLVERAEGEVPRVERADHCSGRFPAPPVGVAWSKCDWRICGLRSFQPFKCAQPESGCCREQPFRHSAAKADKEPRVQNAALCTNVSYKTSFEYWRRIQGMKFNHIGIPTKSRFEGEISLPHLSMTVSDHKNNSFGIQWQRYDADAPYPELVKTVAHVAFEVEDLQGALAGQNVIIEPNSPTKGLIVAFIEVNGAPIELMQIDRSICEEDI